MIVITGAAGFIGSCLTAYLSRSGNPDLILVDDFSREDKEANLMGLEYDLEIDRDEFPAWFEEHASEVEFVFHIGARTDTTEPDWELLKTLNLDYTKRIWEICTRESIPMVYASSAATYGDGALGYNDTHDVVGSLQPLNEYGRSKNEFDKWALEQDETPPSWQGLKFFNVYGPNEYHKGRMASVIFHAYKQIFESGSMNLFQSHHPDYKDGEQLRDFVYVKDVLRVCRFLLENEVESGLYNLGAGKARTFNDLVKAVFHALDEQPRIDYIPTPEDIRDKYQYFTEANMSKLKAQGYDREFTSLEDGVDEYVRKYLMSGSNF